jgi:protocatechuate 3,4-dioxygenase beta subunit
MVGQVISLTGSVLFTDCRPVSSARVDIWQADSRGDYDNVGFRLRGFVISDAYGRYRVETIVPGLYTGRTRHLHATVSAPGRSSLTTQVYFPDDPGNNRDALFDRRLLAAIETQPDGSRAARFDFVLASG